MDKRFGKLFGLTDEQQQQVDKLMTPGKEYMEMLGVEDQGNDEANRLAFTEKIMDSFGPMAGTLTKAAKPVLTAAEALAQAPAKQFGKTIVRDLGEQNYGKVIPQEMPKPERFGSIKQKLTPQEVAAEQKLKDLRRAQKEAQMGKNDPETQAAEKLKAEYLKGEKDLAVESFLSKLGVK